jgi:hypothetical protein
MIAVFAFYVLLAFQSRRRQCLSGTTDSRILPRLRISSRLLKTQIDRRLTPMKADKFFVFDRRLSAFIGGCIVLVSLASC